MVVYGFPQLMASCGAYALTKKNDADFWFFRDDIGAFWGIKGYEEQVSEVGTHHGHNTWPQFRFMGQYNAGSVRRGFQVFAKNCGNCHGNLHRKYDAVQDRGYRQLELAEMVSMFSIHPAHHHYKQYYYQEWDERDRRIEDRMYPPYFSQDQGKNANGGVWPTDFGKIRMRPGGINYIYNVLTGYHYEAPHGIDVPKGKHFNPYFDHMVIGMPRQLYDGMLDMDDGVPASTPQMAFDVSNYLFFLQRRAGHKHNDQSFRNICCFILATCCLYPITHLRVRGLYRSLLSLRHELYAVRDGVYYSHWRYGQKQGKAQFWKQRIWA